ncbi:MAG: GAF domain-containing protein [Anaerolineae bacterium]|nr:MAG: GAF domain-containing protein [Anaerolineae bacterium]
MELTLTSTIALLSTLVYLMLLWISLVRIEADQKLKFWLAAAMLAAALTGLSLLLEKEEPVVGEIKGGGLEIIGLGLTMVMIGGLTFVYLQRKGENLWLLLGIIWIGALTGTAYTDTKGLLGEADWIANTFDPVYVPGALALGGFALFAGFPIMMTFYSFYRATLAEVANRTIFWAIMLSLALMGTILAGTTSSGLLEPGLILQAVGMTGLVYAAVSLRVLDVRRNMWLAISTGVFTVLTIAAIFVPLVIADNTNIEREAEKLGFFVALAFAAALIYMLARGSARSLINRLSGQVEGDQTSRLHHYAEAITGIAELNELIQVTLNELSEVLRVQRSGLLWLPQAEKGAADSDLTSTYILKPSEVALGDVPLIEGTLTRKSPIYQRLFIERKSLSQFEIDFDQRYRNVQQSERDFFKQMRMAIYTPIVAQGQPIGILCAGNKINDDTFTPRDIELMQTMANQAAVALRNARLVDDLRRRETEAKSTATELQATKQRLEQLDAVKTDFITIASHELRTPLAQISGYSDIVQALNEQGLLDHDQLDGIVGNLRKAIDRMEELIRNMLDVSQLDVNAMDLRFQKTTVENIIRLAIEPLHSDIFKRKQSLRARGLSGLPEIEADTKRLVQAFQNIVLNAVKFTPDGGRIEINGSLQNNPETKRDEIVVAISDEGVGIDPKNHQIIFEKFFRAHDPSLHSTGKTKFMGAGPGLGLTIAKGVIDGHGGRIWVESEGYDAKKMPGSIFYVVLPVKPPEDASGILHFEPTLMNADRGPIEEAAKEESPPEVASES